MAIHLNQVGYCNNAKKIAITTKSGTYQLINAKENEVVCEKNTDAGRFDEAAGEETFRIDFSEVTEDGTYYVQAADGETSCQFVIADKPYGRLHKDLIKALYFQRCGCELKEEYAGVYTHKACHTEPAILLEDYMNNVECPKEFEMSGGWHDAGDFGRYSTAAAVALGHLLHAYELFPESFAEELNIPESGNGIPDVLNECLYELNWLIKMQREDGGVYHKLTAWCHAPFLMPEEDKDRFLLYPVSSLAVADFAAVMALASRVYKEFCPEFATQAFEIAKKAWGWLVQHPEHVGFRNPEGSNTGEYGDGCDTDERFWAACEMALADKENASEYIAVAEKLAGQVGKTDFGWVDVSGLGSLAVMTAKGNDFPEKLITCVTDAVVTEAKRLLGIQKTSGYGVAMEPEDYCWGSNMVVCNRGMLFVLCALRSDVAEEEEYKEAVLSQLHYLLGRNAVDYSYVTGHGEHAYKNPHNRPTACDGIEPPMPGWVSGGPFRTPSDEAAREIIPEGTAPMKCYADHVGSYSTNEITIYWNSPAVFMTAFLLRNKGTE